MAAVAAIYAPHVRDGTASFELDPPDEATMASRFDAVTGAGLPWLVAEDATGVVGYAYAGPYRPRPAYRFMLEDSIYVLPEATGRGVGSALMAALIDATSALGARQLLAVVGDPANQAASIALHRRFGFVEVGRLRAAGWKHGAWRDSLFMQRALGLGEAEPPFDG
jgi:phosphinothricin acetyltransferase